MKEDDSNRAGSMNRRALLKTLGAVGVTLAAPSVAGATSTIVTENQKTGTTAWQIGLAPYVNSNDTDQWIRGYASAASINKGDKITFNITVNPYSWKTMPVKYYIDVYRVGWYSGAGGRLMKHLGPFNGVQQPGGKSVGGATTPGPTYDSSTGMISCQWTGDGLGNGSYTLDTSQPTLSGSADWTSGVYLALLTTSQQQYGPTTDPDHQSYITFVIREDSRVADILFQQAIATYQAYNNYPDDRLTGKNVYDDDSYGAMTTLGTQRAVKVSFDRPYTYSDHTGAGELLKWDLYFIRWLERNGYDVTYTTDVDTHVNGAHLTAYKAVLSTGHAEYWSTQMRNAFEAARDSGTSISFWGANPMYSQIRFEPSPITGVANRVIVAYKDATLDPVNEPSSGVYNPALTTVPFRNSPVNRPEQQTVGVMYTDYFNEQAPGQNYIVQNASNWVYAGSGLTNGSSVPGILGYEVDKQFSTAALPAATSGSYALLSSSPFTGANGANVGNSSVYQAAKGPGAWVFGAGTSYWCLALDSYVAPPGVDTVNDAAPNPGIQQVTANFLNRVTGRLANPTQLSATASTSGRYQVTLVWHNNALTQTGVSIERSSNGVSFVQIGTAFLFALTYVDTTAVSGTQYFYRVAAIGPSGNSAYSNVADVPSSPTGLGATAVSTSQINLTWTNNAASDAILIEMSTDDVNFRQIATLAANATTYSSTGLQTGIRYYYRVRAQDIYFGLSAYSNMASAITFGPPAAPTNLVATVCAFSQINLRWQDNSSNETNFLVMRSTDNKNWSQIASVGVSVTTYANTGLNPNTTYYYKVVAINQYGASGASNVASAMTFWWWF